LQSPRSRANILASESLGELLQSLSTIKDVIQRRLKGEADSSADSPFSSVVLFIAFHIYGKLLLHRSEAEFTKQKLGESDDQQSAVNTSEDFVDLIQWASTTALATLKVPSTVAVEMGSPAPKAPVRRRNKGEKSLAVQAPDDSAAVSARQLLMVASVLSSEALAVNNSNPTVTSSLVPLAEEWCKCKGPDRAVMSDYLCRLFYQVFFRMLQFSFTYHIFLRLVCNRMQPQPVWRSAGPAQGYIHEGFRGFRCKFRG
jgi:hypothetical protein